MASFERLGVIPELISAISQPKLNWLLPTPVQDEAIPLILTGGDVMVAAETGSGKTGAFALPILQIVYETLRGEVTVDIDESKLPDQLPPVQIASEMSHDLRVESDGMTISSGNRGWGGWGGCRANVGFFSGAYYYEATVVEGLLRFGWATVASNLNLGSDSQSFGFGGTGKKSHNNNWIEYGQPFSASDTIGCYLNLNSNPKTVSFSVNGMYYGVAFPIRADVAWFPAASIKNGRAIFNFGRKPFKYQPEPGYDPVQSGNVANSTIAFKQQQEQARKERSRRGGGTPAPLALIVSPTKDLTQQIYDDLNSFKTFLTEPPIKTALCMGGVGGMQKAVRGAHIVVGTIGSLIGLLRSNSMTMDECKFFVMDEADRLCASQQGNQQEILQIYSRMPSGVQVMLFSATLHSDDIKNTSEKICHNPTWVDLKGKEYVPDTVHHCILIVDPVTDKQWQHARDVPTDGIHIDDGYWQGGALTDMVISEGIKKLKLLILRKVIDAFDMDQCLIFCRTKLDCDNLERYLTQLGGGRGFRGATDSGKENPYSCVVLHGDRSTQERRDNLRFFKNGDTRFLICTDAGARGLDIKSLPYVINVTMPAESEDYIHRVGRVGRADEIGVAISLVATHKEKVWYHKCANRGRGCTNTRFLEQGGCAKWYDEVDIFDQVEARLGGVKIPVLQQDQLVPGEVKNFIRTIEDKDPVQAAARRKVEQLAPRVEELQEMEITAQNEYLEMPLKFQNMFAG